ncbi:hypothetical protein LMIY3S_03698 [Labrys miyagiensis]
MFARVAYFLAILLFSISAASSADICYGIASTTLQSVNSDGEILNDDAYYHRGDNVGAITQYNVNPRTGAAFICSHGGGCYAFKVSADGMHGDTLDLINCRVNPKVSSVDDGIEYHDIDVVRSKNSKSALRQDDIENRLIDLGACSACAGTMANSYIRHPRSRCAAFTRSVLEGNPVAIKRLSDGDADACN